MQEKLTKLTKILNYIKYRKIMSPKSHRRKIQRFLNYTKSSYVPKFSILSNHILSTCTKSIFTTPANFFHHLASAFERLYYFRTLSFLFAKIGYILFFHLLTSTNPTILLDANYYLTNNDFSKNSCG